MASARSAESFRARAFANPVAAIVVCAVGLTFLGLTILFSASISLKQDPYFYLDKQVVGVAAAGLLCFVASRIDLNYARRASVWIAAIALLLLVLVLIPHLGVSVKGSRRWLGHGSARLQVSEFAKLAMVFCLAHYLALNQTRTGQFLRGYLYPLAIIGAFSGLILLEPDFGTAALALSVGLVLLFLAGAKWRYMLPTIALSAGAFALLVANNPNRLRRFTAFMDVEGNRQGGTYQLYQSLEAFAAGGISGPAWARAASRSTTSRRPTRTSSSPSSARSSGSGSRSGLSRCSRSSSSPGSRTCAGPRTSSTSCSQRAACCSCACSQSSTWVSSQGSCRQRGCRFPSSARASPTFC